MRKEEKADQQNPSHKGRRDFIKLAGLSAVAGGAATIVSGGEAAAADAGAGYRETAHVKEFYATARF